MAFKAIVADVLETNLFNNLERCNIPGLNYTNLSNILTYSLVPFGEY
jgi:hypothetical protein